MKKTIFILIVICVITVFIFAFFNSNDEYLLYDGSKLLLNATLEQQNGIVIYDYSKNEYDEIMLEGSQALFGENNCVFLKKYNSIVKYDYNSDKEDVIYSGEEIDYFTICNDNRISFSSNEHIFLFDHTKNEKIVIVKDNGSKIHAWSDDGNFLYYSDMDDRIKCLNLNSSNVEYICDGYAPIVNGFKLAYMNQGNLYIRDLNTNETIEYDGYAYSYCFSPNGDALLIEDNISLRSAIKNNFMIYRHSLIIWEYKSNKKAIAVEACLATPNMVCDWK